MDIIETPNSFPVKESFSVNLRRPRMFSLLVILISLATLATTLFLVQRNQSLQSRAEQPEGLPSSPQGFYWQLVWSDEFEGNQINSSNWEVIGDEPRRDGWWVKEDAYLDGQGRLVLRTKKDGDRYTSGAVRTKGRFEHAFGYYEARVKFPSQQGHWPAFWLFSNSVNNVDGSGRDGTEIDIIEKPWTSDLVHQALHWDGYGGDHQAANKTEISIPGISQEWHTVGLDWRTDGYTFYIDGQVTWSTSAGGVSQIPEYIKLTEEIGQWIGNIENANLPDYFTVDYVRVYDLVEQSKETPTPASTTTEPSASPEPTATIQCLNIKAFSIEWNELSAIQLSQLKTNDQVNFCVNGTTTSGVFDKAKLTINGVVQDETTTRRPVSDDFCQLYTIPVATTSFNVSAQIHHSIAGWF